MSSLRHIAKALHRHLPALFAFLLLPLFSQAAETPPIDATNVAAWADRTFGEALQKHAFSGLTVSVVRDGEIIFSRGYGRADFARPDPVDPATTQFRIGSITKTFTATIIAQLIEEGRIASPDDPANRYLRDYQLPDNDGVAITLHHLLTHTAGFEDQFYFIGADEPISTHPPAPVFDSLRPAYVRPAGARVEYSNFGIAVLGRIVEDITGMGIAQAMRTRIFEPLGMRHTLLMDDIAEPANLGKPATIHADGTFAPTPFTAISPPIAAAGSIASTADDMARYMLAQLGASIDPATGSAPLLSRAVLDRLHTRRTGNAPDATGLAMVFFLDDWAGVPTIAHGGNWTGFHSWMTLIPSQNAGIFVSMMSEAPGPTVAGDLRSVFMPWTTPDRSPAVLSGSVYARAFLSHFLGERGPMPAASVAAADDVAGWYRPDRRPFTTSESVADLVYLGTGTIHVEAADSGIKVGGAGPWHFVGDGVFMLDAPTRDRVIIRPDARVGAPVLIPDLGLYTATRISWYQHPRLHVYVALAAMLAGIVALVVLQTRSTTPAICRTLAWITVLAGIALIPIAYLGRADGADMLSQLYAGHSGRMAMFVITANGMLLAAVATLGVAFLRRREAERSLPPLTTIGIAGLVLALVLVNYNVIGWQLPG